MLAPPLFTNIKFRCATSSSNVTLTICRATTFRRGLSNTTSPAAAQAAPTVMRIPYHANEEYEHNAELARDKASRANVITLVELLVRPPIVLAISSMDIVLAVPITPTCE